MKHNLLKEVNVVRLFLGFSLLEVLISLFLGSILMLIAAQFYIDLFYAQNKQRELFKLQQNTHQLLTDMQKHIQHIGYQGNHRKQSNYLLFLKNNKAYSLSSPHCLIFFYDLNNDGCIGDRKKTLACEKLGTNNTDNVNQEIFGFKLLKHNLFTFDDKKFSKCKGMECQRWVDCNANKWANITELSDYQVENLVFKWVVPEKLLQIDLTLKSVKFPQINYHSKAYSYLLNHGE